MPFYIKNNDIPLYRILVLEPYDIIWWGIQQMIHSVMDNRVSLIRITETDRLADTVLRYDADAVLLGVLGHRTDMLPLLQQLSSILRSQKTVHIAAYLRKELPHLKELLRAFGVNTVFNGPFDPATLTQYLTPEYKTPRPVRLTAQERQVAQSLLAGQSVTRVARLMEKDIRTISTPKQAVLAKLNMVSRADLQVLGGQLMAEECLA